MEREEYEIDAFDDDNDYEDEWNEALLEETRPSRGRRRKAAVTARRAIEDYLERKRMRSLLDDDPFEGYNS